MYVWQMVNKDLDKKMDKNKNLSTLHNYDKKVGVWMNGRIGSRQIKVGLEQTVE